MKTLIRCMQGHSFQDGFLRTVAEIHILQGYVSFYIFQCDGFRNIRFLGRFIYDFEDMKRKKLINETAIIQITNSLYHSALGGALLHSIGIRRTY